MACMIRLALMRVFGPRCSRRAALAQSYPTRPIRLIVSFPPGGAVDIVARLVGQPLSARLGQPVVIENRPGANGNLAGELVAKAAPDGYTLLAGPTALFGINPHLYAQMPVDPLKDLVPIASVQVNTLLLTVNPTLVSVKDFRDFVELARATKPPLFYASIGNGSEHHLAMEMLKRRAGIDLIHVPYAAADRPRSASWRATWRRCSAAARSCRWSSPASCAGSPPAERAGRRCCPTCRRSPNSIPGYEVTIWQGLFAPVGTPPAIVERLRTEIDAVPGGAGVWREAERRRVGRADGHDAGGVRSTHSPRPREVRRGHPRDRRQGGVTAPMTALPPRLELLVGKFRCVRRLEHHKRDDPWWRGRHCIRWSVGHRPRRTGARRRP